MFDSLSPLARAWTLVVGFLTIVFILIRRGKQNTNGHRLPPGPKGLPLIGNILQIPSDKPWKVYRDWKELYGDMIFLEVPGQPMLVLNTLEDCLALLEKRGANYSDRMLPTGAKMMHLNIWNWGFEMYGQRLKEYRRVFHQLLSPKQIPQYQPVIEEEVHTFLHRLLSTPDDFAQHVRGFIGIIITRIAYGCSDTQVTNVRVAEAEHLVTSVLQMLRPGRLLVDFIPALRHVPTWLPGAGWKRELEGIRDLAYRLAHSHYDEAKGRLEGGKGAGGYPSIVQQFLSMVEIELKDADRGHIEEIGRFTASLSFLAGADTSIATGLGLFGALASTPEVQLKAYTEIGRVVGHDRLPQLSDLEHLPYIKAILKELGRWHVVTPFTIPHLSREDDEYKGYLIPQGTMVIANAWAILHDPKVFEDPEIFNPGRYIDANGNFDTTVLDPEAVAFGWGRRICPGRHLSFEIISLMIASLLAVFEVKPPVDESGQPMTVHMDVASDIVAKPLPFGCRIVPRSEKLASLLRG